MIKKEFEALNNEEIESIIREESELAFHSLISVLTTEIDKMNKEMNDVSFYDVNSTQLIERVNFIRGYFNALTKIKNIRKDLISYLKQSERK